MKVLCTGEMRKGAMKQEKKQSGNRDNICKCTRDFDGANSMSKYIFKKIITSRAQPCISYKT